MSNLRYAGKAPNSDASVVTKQFIDNRHTAVKVTPTVVNEELAAGTINLATTSYVDAADATRAKKTAVDSADTNYVPNTQIGVANGVASLGADNYVPSAQLPTLSTDRPYTFVDASSVMLSAEVTTTTTNSKEYQAATLSITDPGYPYFALPIATVAGSSPGGGTYGKISVLSSADVVHGGGLGGPQVTTAVWSLFPYGAQNVTPSTVPPLNGNLTLNLWLACWSGASYKWTPFGFSFFALVVPAVG
jgi:hypothetical protein